MQQKFILQSKTYYYWVTGDKSHPPILVIPGYTGTHNDLITITSSLRKHYYIIIPDMPGWGKSPRLETDATIQNYALFLKKLLEFLSLQSTIIIGHCMGTAIAIEFALLYQNSVEKLILLSPPYDYGTITRKCMVFLTDMAKRSPKPMRYIFFLWRARIVTSVAAIFILKVRSYRIKLRLIRHIWEVQPNQDEEVVQTNWYSLMHYPFNKVKYITKPIHIIHGEKDVLVSLKNARKFSSLISHSTFEVLKGGGHNLQIEQPTQLEKLIARYLQ